MKSILRIFIYSIVLFCCFSSNMMSMKPEGEPTPITMDSKNGDNSLGVPADDLWKAQFLEEVFYKHFDYFKVWMKTESNGDKHENGKEGSAAAEYPISNSVFNIVNGPFTDANGKGWQILTKSETMFEAYAPADWYTLSGDFYFWLWFKTLPGKTRGVTMYFEAFDTKSEPGVKKLVNFCAINWDESWHCNNFDRVVNVYIDPEDPGNTGYHLGLITQWHTINNLPDPSVQISFWPFDDCPSQHQNYDPNLTYDQGNGHHNGLLVGAEREQGFVGKGIKFNGNNLVDIGNQPDFDFGFDHPFTVAGWVNFKPWGDFGDFICKMSPPSPNSYRGWGLGAGNYGNYCNSPNNVGGFRFDLNEWWDSHAIVLDVPGATNTYWYDPSKTGNARFRAEPNANGWGDENWHFVVATYTANTYNNSAPPKKASADDLTVYIDGAKAGCCKYVGGSPSNMLNDASMRFGYRNSSDPTRGYHGNLDEVYAFNKALTPLEQAAIYAYYTSVNRNSPCQGFPPSPTLVLDLEPSYALDKNGNLITTTGTPVQTILDRAFNPVPEDAVMTDLNRQPTFELGVFGDYRPGVKFTYDYGNLNYGKSDIMQSPYDKEITSDVTTMYSPDVSTPKTLIVEFKVGESVNKDGIPHPYYSDGRQTIFEAGGPLSGFNVYISNGYLCFGMWNRFERKYIQYNGQDKPAFYPLDPNSIYLANLEFDNNNKRFRASVSKAVTDVNTSPAVHSEWVPFSGLIYDGTTGSADWSGVGGSCRTAYYDYSTGETYSDHFGGYIGGIWLLNELLSNSDLINDYYAFYGGLLGGGYHFAVPPYDTDPKLAEDWSIYDNNSLPESAILSEAFPNPFVTRTSFGINLPEKQIVTVELYDAMGIRVKSLFAGELGKGMHDFVIDGSNLASGMYIFRAIGDGFVQSGKVILSK